MRTSDTSKKYRRWPPRVKRHRPREDDTPAQSSPPAPPEAPQRPKPDDGSARSEAGRDVKVSFRHRRKVVTHEPTD